MIKIVPIEILTQFFFFIACIVILNFFVFRPIMRIVNARESLIRGYKRDGDRLASELESKKNEYQSYLSEAYQISHHEKESLIERANREKDTMIDKAKKESNRMILDIKTASEKQLLTSKGKIDALSDTIATVIVKKLLNE